MHAALGRDIAAHGEVLLEGLGDALEAGGNGSVDVQRHHTSLTPAGATAACANLLVQRGLLDLDAPVTDYWPEYGVNGKDKTLVRWILSHKAGVLAMPDDLDPSAFDMSAFVGPHLVTATSLNGILPDLGVAALDRRYRAAELGGAGGVASGRGLSRLYAWLLGEFTPETIADILRSETDGPDQVLSGPAMTMEQKIGRGYMVPPPDQSPAGVPTFGHGGAGGSSAFADPERRVAFGHAMTLMLLGPDPANDPRVTPLVQAVYDSLD